MLNAVTLPSGDTLSLPAHHHVGRCACTDALAYVRVSDVAGRDELESPNIQLRAIVTLAETVGLRLVGLVGEIGVSGQTFAGRYIEQAIREIRAGAYRAIVVYDISRWGRDLEMSMTYMRLVREAGGTVYTATEPNDDSPAGLFMRQMMMMWADFQGKNIGKAWRASHQSRRDKGLPHSGRPRFGYDYVEKRYVPNGDAPLLADLYRRYVAGQSLRSLVRELNARGVRTTLGKPWTPQSLGKMLDTGFGAGYLRERSEPGMRPANRLANYDVWRTGSHEPVITEAEWRAYRSRRESQSELPARTRTAVHSVSALLFCGLCGRRLTTKYQGRNRTHQWACLHRAAFHPETHVGVSNAMMLDLLHGWVEDRAPGNTASRIQDDVERLARASQAVSDVRRLERELERSRKRLDNLEEMRIDGEISKERYAVRKAAEDDRVRELEADLKAAEAASKDSGGDLGPVFTDLADNWGRYATIPAGHRELLCTVVAGVLVFPGKGKLELPSRVSVFPRWQGSVLSSRVAALRASS